MLSRWRVQKPYGSCTLFLLYTLDITSIVSCGSLPSPLNGQVQLNGTTVGSVANYSCNRRYILNGTSTRTCEADGEWSGDPPTCEREKSSTVIFNSSFRTLTHNIYYWFMCSELVLTCDYRPLPVLLFYYTAD